MDEKLVKALEGLKKLRHRNSNLNNIWMTEYQYAKARMGSGGKVSYFRKRPVIHFPSNFREVDKRLEEHNLVGINLVRRKRKKTQPKRKLTEVDIKKIVVKAVAEAMAYYHGKG
jgi:hypothetical protein